MLIKKDKQMDKTWSGNKVLKNKQIIIDEWFEINSSIPLNKTQLLLPLPILNCQRFPCCFQFGNFGNLCCCLLHLITDLDNVCTVPSNINACEWKFESQHIIWFNRKFKTIERFFVVIWLKHLMILKKKRNVV